MQYEIVTRDREAKALARDLNTVKFLPFDTETDCTVDGLDWKREKQIMHQYVYKDTAYLVDLRTVDAQHFKKPLENPDIKKLIHSSIFDAAWTKREHNINIVNIGDTKNNEILMLGMNLPRRPLKGMKMVEFNLLKPKYSSSLNYCLQRRNLPSKFEFTPFHWFEQWVEFQRKEGRGKKAVFSNWECTLDDFPYIEQEPNCSYKQLRQFSSDKLEVWSDLKIEYSVRDVEFLEQLYDDQVTRLAQMNMGNLMQLEELVAEIVYQMSCNGFGFDSKKWLKYAEDEEVIYHKLMRELNETINVGGVQVDWSSPKQYCNYFGAENADALDKMTAAEVEKQGGIVMGVALDLFKEARKHYKHVTTYGKSFVEQHVINGKVHCNYTQIINTGRFACDDPNLQNIETRDHDGKLTPHRSCFVPGNITPAIAKQHGGKRAVFVIGDFSGQELAIMAAGAREPFWLDVLRNRGDLHAAIAEILDPVVWPTLDAAGKKVRRRIIKTINFGLPYGSGVYALAERAEMEVEEMQDALNSYFAKFPRLKRYLDENGRTCELTGRSFSFPPFNRLRTTHLEFENWRKRNIGKNNPIQATAADMTKLGMVLLHKQLKVLPYPALMIHQLHDELVNETVDKYGEEVKQIMVTQMSRACEKILGEPLSHPEVKIQFDWAKED